MPLTAGAKLGMYEILSRLGAGGMGEVYLAQDTKLDRKVALKILPAEVADDKDRMRRFVQEARAAAALNHPNIAHVYEIGEAEGVNFITMEFVDGTTLREVIRDIDTDLKTGLRYLQQVAEALAKAHDVGIVHRDLKPDNIMITHEGHAKIVDFGLAKRTAAQPTSNNSVEASEVTTVIVQEHTMPGLIFGSVGYMSPEQALGRTSQIDHRSDVFSFGCVLYEIITRRRAFEGTDTIDTLNKIIHRPVAPIADSRPDIPIHLERIVERCLLKDPGARYQSIKDVAIDLRELRREMDGNAGIDGAIRATGQDSALHSSTKVLSDGTKRTAPSTAFVATAFKQHKVSLALVALVLVICFIAFYLYLPERNADARIESIAVLPFANQGADPENEYLSDGLTESIINSLTQLPSLRVIPRSSVFRYKGKDTDILEVGHNLAVRAVLTGRLLRHGDNLMVGVELTDVRDNKQVWGEQYNRRVSDALATQQDISREISERLRAKLSGDEQRRITRRDTTDPEAYQLYLKGRYYWNKRNSESLKKAIDHFSRAVDKDPVYALAYVGLADCYAVLEEYSANPTSDTAPKARKFAEQALKIDNSLAEAHATLGHIFDQLWQWTEAENEFTRALSLNSNYPTMHQWYSIHLRNLGHVDQALTEIKRAQELDPLSLVIAANVSEIFLMKGNLDSSIDQSKRMIELDDAYPPGHEMLGLAYLKQGRSESLGELRKAVELSAEGRQILSSLGYGYAVSGMRVEANEILEKLKTKYERHEAFGRDLAAVYAGLGDKNKALMWLEKDFQARVGLAARTSWETVFESLHNEAGFIDLVRSAGLLKQ